LKGTGIKLASTSKHTLKIQKYLCNTIYTLLQLCNCLQILHSNEQINAKQINGILTG